MNIPSDIEQTQGIAICKWKDYHVNWLVAPFMDKGTVRQKVGNAMCLIIFHDSDDTDETTMFDPSHLFLGQVSNFCCVVEPVSVSIDEKQTWRCSFFCHYETKNLGKYDEVDQIYLSTKRQEQHVSEKLAAFGPDIPDSYCFDQLHLSEFIITKSFNARLQASQHHGQVKKQFEYPAAQGIEVFAKKYHPDWFK